ncbi:ubiquitin-conjugating enzyme E2 14-like [Pyrus ussuriensis x Pyrus communis]|uniref:Ubiquitin-conjugating enzyme E2 14-like n=1 Tax=Pyrus ussuriensis x Pyrus communis TaxID=2448454 RepID=A0A5N5FXE5_9ROSA|nr:ubiquitin-conjugating enzyme E2 14-like [Pyrus ussuriensis x Pyrus communis]
MNTKAILDQALKFSFIVFNSHVPLFENQELLPPDSLKLKAHKTILKPLLEEIVSPNLISSKVETLLIVLTLWFTGHLTTSRTSSICSNQDFASSPAPRPSRE